MYIEKIKIDKFRVLEDIEICFQAPNSATAHPETGNVVNVIAGVNGCGKTSVLDLLLDLQKGFFDFKERKSNNRLSYNPSAVGVVVNDINSLPNNKSLLFFTNKGEFQVGYSEFMSMSKIEDDKLPNYFYLHFFDFDKFSRKITKKQLTLSSSESAVYKDIEEVIANYLLFLERTIDEANPQKRSEKALNMFNNIFNGVDFYTKLHIVSYENGRMKPEFINANGAKVNLSDLSDGEQRLYMSAMDLMRYFPQDYIILMDEPEISLHPAWQQKIMQIYSRIGKNNQFIVATHSPQIIASVPYQNRILLRKENGKIAPVHCSQPPSGLDVNSILSEIMGAEPRPPEVLELYRQYRQFVEERKENTPEALAVRAKLSEESDHSQFMQEMNFLIDMRDL